MWYVYLLQAAVILLLGRVGNAAGWLEPLASALPLLGIFSPAGCPVPQTQPFSHLGTDASAWYKQELVGRVNGEPSHLASLPWKPGQLQNLPLFLCSPPMTLTFPLSCPYLWLQTFLYRVEVMVSSLLAWFYGHLTLAVTRVSMHSRVSRSSLCSAVTILKFLVILNKGPHKLCSQSYPLHQISLPSAFWGYLRISNLPGYPFLFYNATEDYFIQNS